MKLFQQLPEVQKYLEPADFVKDYEIGENDFILASKSIYDKYFKGMNLKATVCFKNTYGKGNAYYVAFRNDDNFTEDFCEDLIKEMSIKADTEIKAVDGVSIRKRGDLIFVMNFADESKTVKLDREYKNVVTGESVNGEITLDVCEYLILGTRN